MKKVFLFCLLLACSLTIKADINSSIKNMVLRYAANVCRDVDYQYDYYYCDRLVGHIFDSNKTRMSSVFVFVDMEPSSSWEHECKYVYIAKDSVLIDVQDSIVPPSNLELKPLRIGDRSNRIESFQLPRIPQSNDEDAAMRTYAVILNGGMNVNGNYERYRNDCSFIYQTLCNTYNIPKSHIKVVYADGTNPAPDLRLSDTWELVNSNLDLDNDSIPDIEYPATKTALQTVFDNLSTEITDEDILLVFVTDHGGKSKTNNEGYLYLWNNEKLYPGELAEYLEPINAQAINIVMGQCYSGSFIDELSDKTRAITTAVSADEKSYEHPDMPFDSFLYYWTSAIAKQDPLGNPVNADFDNDGYISLSEAYKYAKDNNPYANGENRMGHETPQFDVTAGVLKDDLAFDRIPEAVDLFLRDNKEDTGKEPNTSDTNGYWNSPDLYLRMQNDGFINTGNQLLQIEDSESDEAEFYVYVNIHNRGTRDYIPREGKKYLHLFVTNANGKIAFSKFRGTSLFGKEIGERVAVKPLNDIIPAGDSILYEIQCNLVGDFTKCVSLNNTIPIASMGYLSDYMTLANIETYEQNNLSEYLESRSASNDLALRNHAVIVIRPDEHEMKYEEFDIGTILDSKMLFYSSNHYIDSIASVTFIPASSSHKQLHASRFTSLSNYDNAHPYRVSNDEKSVGVLKFDISDIFHSNRIEDGDTFTVMQVDEATQEIIGGVTYVFTFDQTSENNSTPMSIISDMTICNNTLELQFDEPLHDATISVSTSSPFVKSIERNTTGLSTIERIDLPSDFSGLLVVNVVKDQTVIGSRKIVNN